MGWFSSSQPQQPDAASRSERQKCWDTRDAYFKCLDAAGVLTPGEEAKGQCQAENQVYEQNCAKSWASSASLCPCADRMLMMVLRLTISTKGACWPSSKRAFLSRPRINELPLANEGWS
jgi:hypothetical protein